jgi:hypothetical protein
LGERIVAIKMLFNASISEMMDVFEALNLMVMNRKIRKGEKV